MISHIEDVEEHPEDEEPAMSSIVEYEKKHIPEHPYCTNWPTNRKETNEKL